MEKDSQTDRLDHIKKLPGHVVDQIAAGEVIERPAQLLKELMENSLDAEASELQVSVSSDLSHISVSDDGHGIKEEDLSLVFERHSTSKIQKTDDLFSLKSFGFRGEALSAIGAVSKAQLETKHEDDNNGHLFVYENGEVMFKEASERKKGTSLSITHLFDSTPARKKFLKSKRYELTLVKRVFQSFVLLHFDKKFKLLIDGKMESFYPEAETVPKRYEQVFKNKKVFKIDLPVCEIIQEGSCLYLEEPSIESKTGLNLWTYVQDRWIQDKTVAAAIREGLNTYLMHGCFPRGVADLKIKEDFIDVNVHPMKSEVRYENSSYIYKVVRKSVKDWAFQAPWKEEVMPTASKPSPMNANFIEKTKPLKKDPVSEPSFYSKRKPESEEVQSSLWAQSFEKSSSESFFSDQRVQYKKTTGDLKSSFKEKVLKKEDSFEPYWSTLMVSAQINLTYILAQSDEALFLIDQHAAHERVAYERLKRQWETEEKKEVQNLLMPLHIDLEASQVEALLSVQSDLQAVGVEIESSGPELLALNATPSFLKEEAVEKALRELSNKIMSQGGGSSLDEVFELFFATVACHSVIRAGHAMSDDEMKLLLLEMDRYKSRYCPHGRPVYKKITFASLDQDFGRTV